MNAHINDLRPQATKIKLDGNDYGMMFTLNVINDIQSQFNCSISDMEKLFYNNFEQIEGKTDEELKELNIEPIYNMGNIRDILTFMINDWIEEQNDSKGLNMPLLNNKWVGRKLDLKSFGEYTNSIKESVTNGMPETDEDSEENFTKSE